MTTPTPHTRATATPEPFVVPVEAALPTDANARARGTIALLEENCTVCMLCVRDCPDWCIHIEAHQETSVPADGGRPRQRNMLDRFAIDFGLCMYCGICIEVCPFDALFWAPTHDYPAATLDGLTHERTDLRRWLADVPPPPVHDPNGEEPKEVAAARTSVTTTANTTANTAVATAVATASANTAASTEASGSPPPRP